VDELEEPLLAAPEAGPDREDVERIVESIRAQDGGWAIGEAQSYGSVRWRPDLMREDTPAVLHVHVADRLRPYMTDRLRAAFVDGKEIHVALPLSALYDEELLLAVHELDPQIHLIGPDEASAAAPGAILTVLCDQGVQVSPVARKALGAAGAELAGRDATTYVSGRRYEAVIAFLLSQIRDFDVVERNFRTETEELDAVVQIRATQGRVWTGMSAPLILVEAKNWKTTPVSQKEVSNFRVKMLGRRGTVRIGLMFGASGFSSDALDQELRFSAEDLTIVCVAPDELAGWIAADDVDEYVEGLVRRAMLR
jgi:hypothetical protein